MMQKKEILFTDLEAAANEKDRVSRVRSVSTWEAIDYETEAYSGVMLVAPQDSHPEEITIDLGLHGWYKLYIGLINFGSMYTYLKLDGDLAFSGITTRGDGNDGIVWATYETCNEVFWKNAELSGDKLHIMHPKTYAKELSAVLWIRCVEMTPEEIETHKKQLPEKGPHKLHAHIDTDFMNHDNLNAPQDALTILQHLDGTDVTMCTQECAMDYSGYCDEAASEDYMGLRTADRARNQAFIDFFKFRKEAYRCMIDYCHKIGIRLHSAMRMQICSFLFPTTYPTFRMKFAEEHPEFSIKTREGRTVAVMSYAYPEVREYVIGILVDMYRNGFDGITLQWIRGNSFGFEQPVLDRIAEKYNGLDGRRLPMADERLHSVWCEFMNIFMRDLRAALDAEAAATGRAKCNIHSIGMFTPEQCKHMGLDVETWAKEGWVDGVTAAMYWVYEELDDCMAEEDPSLIDLEKYCEKIRKTFVLRRLHWMDVDLMCQGIRGYEAIAAKYDIETYYSLGWERQSPEVYAKEAAAFYECGARGIHTWDTNGRVKYPPEWHVTSRLGHPEKCATAAEDYEALSKTYRVLRLNNNDISYICANWRG